jgi:hypothetical protein
MRAGDARTALQFCAWMEMRDALFALIWGEDEAMECQFD